MPNKSFQPPKGTRDFYPQDLLRRRYITETWRAVSIRHGFEEIDSPTFEHAELYAVKSGEGILSELFQAFSGKDQAEIDQLRETGRAPFALRPEFTPSLARMYAARAKQLPKPTRWFSIPNFFRAEKPQRGRLREFFQWNCDVMGDDSPQADAEVIACAVGMCRDLGLTKSNLQVLAYHRRAWFVILSEIGVPEEVQWEWLDVIDQRSKLPTDEFRSRISALSGDEQQFIDFFSVLEGQESDPPTKEEMQQNPQASQAASEAFARRREVLEKAAVELKTIRSNMIALGLEGWFEIDPSIVRGLAYYTGTVFEVIAEGERAVAGGGRYDNLIELFGGPPTPACGFGMGDVVLSNLLDDSDLFPSGPELMSAIDRIGATTSLRPEAFIVPASEDADEHIAPLLARLRRGTESESYTSREDRKPWHADRYCPATNGLRPLHARTTDKSTRNLKKLLADAQKQFARLCVIIHQPENKKIPPTVQLKDFDANQDLTPADIPGGSKDHAEFSLDPAAPNDIARAIVALLDQ